MSVLRPPAAHLLPVEAQEHQRKEGAPSREGLSLFRVSPVAPSTPRSPVLIESSPMLDHLALSWHLSFTLLTDPATGWRNGEVCRNNSNFERVPAAPSRPGPNLVALHTLWAPSPSTTGPYLRGLGAYFYNACSKRGKIRITKDRQFIHIRQDLAGEKNLKKSYESTRPPGLTAIYEAARIRLRWMMRCWRNIGERQRGLPFLLAQTPLDSCPRTLESGAELGAGRCSSSLEFSKQALRFLSQHPTKDGGKTLANPISLVVRT